MSDVVGDVLGLQPQPQVFGEYQQGEIQQQQAPPENGASTCGFVCTAIETITSQMDRFVEEQPVIALVCAVFAAVFALSQIIPFGSIIMGIPLLYFAYCVFSRIWANPAEFAANFNAAAAQQGGRDAIAPQQPQVPRNAFLQMAPQIDYSSFDPTTFLAQQPTLEVPSFSVSTLLSTSAAATTSTATSAASTAATATTATAAATATASDASTTPPSKRGPASMVRSLTLPRPPAKVSSDTPAKKPA